MPPIAVAAKNLTLSSESDRETVQKEVDMLKLVAGHPSVITCHGFEEVAGPPKTAWVFMELASGGELFDRLIDSGNLTERATWPYARALVDGVLYCHSKGVVHRDVKLENIMLCVEDPHAIKLIDFGLAVQ